VEKKDVEATLDDLAAAPDKESTPPLGVIERGTLRCAIVLKESTAVVTPSDNVFHWPVFDLILGWTCLPVVIEAPTDHVAPLQDATAVVLARRDALEAARWRLRLRLFPPTKRRSILLTNTARV